MECFERELHEYVVAVEREGLAEELVMVPMKDGGAHRSARTPRRKASTLAVRRATKKWAVGR